MALEQGQTDRLEEQNRKFTGTHVHSQLVVNKGSKGIRGGKESLQQVAWITMWGREVVSFSITSPTKCNS